MQKNAIDYVLSDEEVANLPEAIRDQRDAHVQFIREMETQNPIADGGSSVDDLTHAIMMRVIVDAATRDILANGGTNGKAAEGND